MQVCIIIKYLAGHSCTKITKNHYPSNDAEIVADDRVAQAKLAYHVVMMAGYQGLKSALHKGKG